MYGAQSSAKPVLDIGGECGTRKLRCPSIDVAGSSDNVAENSFCRFFENMPQVGSTGQYTATSTHLFPRSDFPGPLDSSIEE